jgi:alanyl-tRNA synthetase
MERSLATASTAEDVMSKAIEVDGIRVLAASVDAPSVDALRYRGDAVRKGLRSGVAVLASVIDERPMFIAIVTDDVIKRGPKAGDILKRVATVAGGSGGGRPDMAQGGGKDPEKVDDALAIVPDVVREMLKN